MSIWVIYEEYSHKVLRLEHFSSTVWYIYIYELLLWNNIVVDEHQLYEYEWVKWMADEYAYGREPVAICDMRAGRFTFTFRRWYRDWRRHRTDPYNMDTLDLPPTVE